MTIITPRNATHLHVHRILQRDYNRLEGQYGQYVHLPSIDAILAYPWLSTAPIKRHHGQANGLLIVYLHYLLRPITYLLYDLELTGTLPFYGRRKNKYEASKGGPISNKI